MLEDDQMSWINDQELLDQLDDLTRQYELSKDSRSYTFLEDMRIIVLVGKNGSQQPSAKFFNEIVANKRILRSVESIKDRFKRFIRFLHRKDLYVCLDHLEHKGSTGFLSWKKTQDGLKHMFSKFKNNYFRFSSVTLIDPVETKKKLHDDYPYENDENLKDELDQLEKQNISNNSSRNITLDQEFVRREIEKLGSLLNQNDSQLISVYNTDRNNLQFETPTNSFSKGTSFHQQKLDCLNLEILRDKLNDTQFFEQYLNEIIDEIQKTTKKSRLDLLQLLDQTSGDLILLKEYLKSEKKELLWDECEDKCLLGAEHPYDPHFQILLKYKTINQIEKRLEFMGIILPFQI